MLALPNPSEEIVVKYLSSKLYSLYLFNDWKIVSRIINAATSALPRVSCENKFRIITALIQTYLYYGDLDEAAKWHLKAEQITTNHKMSNKHYLGLYQFTKAWLFFENDKNLQALEFINESIQNLNSIGIKTVPYFFALNLKAEILLSLKKSKEALQLSQSSFNQGYKYIEELKIKNQKAKHFLSEARYLIGRCKLELGLNLEEAKKDIKNAIADQLIYFDGQKHSDQAAPYVTLGDILNKEKRYTEARNAYLDAEKILNKIYHKKQVNKLSLIYEKILNNEIQNTSRSKSIIYTYTNKLKTIEEGRMKQ